MEDIVSHRDSAATRPAVGGTRPRNHEKECLGCDPCLRSAARLHCSGDVLLVDGCDSDCAKKTMELGGLTGFIHLRVSDLGLEKGKTAFTDERIEMVATKLCEQLGRRLEVAEA